MNAVIITCMFTHSVHRRRTTVTERGDLAVRLFNFGTTRRFSIKFDIGVYTKTFRTNLVFFELITPTLQEAPNLILSVL
jgi:hypothetical protein